MLPKPWATLVFSCSGPWYCAALRQTWVSHSTRVTSVWCVSAQCEQVFSPGTLSVFSTAGRFSLMRKANWGRQTCLMPWRRSQRNTTVSYRQTPQRTKYDGPGEPQPSPTQHVFFFCFPFWQHGVRNTAEGLISRALDSHTLENDTLVGVRVHAIVRLSRFHPSNVYCHLRPQSWSKG